MTFAIGEIGLEVIEVLIALQVNIQKELDIKDQE